MVSKSGVFRSSQGPKSIRWVDPKSLPVDDRADSDAVYLERGARGQLLYYSGASYGV